MTESIIDVSRCFFFEVLKPILESNFPAATAQTTFGVFGYGSEGLRLDDEHSADHHWGIRVNALMPEQMFAQQSADILRVVEKETPATYRGHNLRDGYSAGKGLSLTSLEGYLLRTVGLTRVPQTFQEWLNVPEEDITHVVNGEIWQDDAGQFSAVRAAFLAYYPEPVRLRRIAHWCRYFSGMGTYALKRALLRYNEWYAAVTFARAIRLGVQLAFLLDKQYCPYDKWTMAFFSQLPRLYYPLAPIVNEAVSLATPWARKLDLLNQMADILDQTMVADGIVPPHPVFKSSPSSGYRLLEHNYAEILRTLPEEIRTIVPVWDQIYLERFHSGYVASLEMDTWDGLLNLEPVD
ncbi:MAG: DUF4037 domain-containing protein [Anaerolineae bacterium]|nr:DUF4037 domain-containing protein [Anaerolineae bacterium]